MSTLIEWANNSILVQIDFTWKFWTQGNEIVYFLIAQSNNIQEVISDNR